MFKPLGGLLWSLLLTGLAHGSPLAESHPHVLEARQSCNTASNRQCWTSNFDVNTDYEAHVPETGVTRQYTLTLTEQSTWRGGDGRLKYSAMLVNGQFPGPTISANWGDRLQITVINNMRSNGTSIHYHGLRMLNANTQDGVNGVTECPIPPGSRKTYTFLANQYGTAWYHSHFPLQYGNGILGPIVIKGPASADYDTDLGPLVLSDWYYGSVFEIAHRVNNPSNPFIPNFPGSPPASDNVLLNGRNINPDGSGGSYTRKTLTKGKNHLLRLINTSLQNAFTVSLVGHTFQVVATDMVPIKPITRDHLFLGIGQRYDVVINANQPTANYWFNVTFSALPCGQSDNPYPAAIFSYSGASSTSLPTQRGVAPPDSRCAAPERDYSPIVSRSADVNSFVATTSHTLNVDLTVDNSQARVFWPVNNSPLLVNWQEPTLRYVANNTLSSIPRSRNLIQVPGTNTLTYFLIQNNSSIPHPIHLHGHDIMILGSSPPLANPLAETQVREYNPNTDKSTLKGNNPPRRDTTMLPAWGWLLVAWRTNNPGVWIFHCHVGWHVSQGLGVQILERLDALRDGGGGQLSEIGTNCGNWGAWYPGSRWKQDDSGL
ncbi:multicopper oxidase-domain-containing protein [Sordaria sp. MPI-SDFR-AT-0083]|nr:multicopper oxidase-domain-containing protein [Sordaria sp. MPI-SDFR-AT-0083]